MDEGIDSGDIISQKTVPIFDDDDAGTLYSRVTEIALKQIEDFLPRLEVSMNASWEQTQNGGSYNCWRKRKPADGVIDWRMSARSIHNLVRGLAKPYVGAQFEYSGQCIKVWKSSVEASWPENIEPGKILLVDSDGVVVKAGEGAVRLILFDPVKEFKEGTYL